MKITDITGRIPYRLALAGGWIDQPFVSRHNPDGIGSMVTVGIEPQFKFMDRAGIASSTRVIADRLWKGKIPKRDPRLLAKELYEEENRLKADPSGSQDMIGLIYPGVNRLDYSIHHEGGLYPVHIETSRNKKVAAWLEQVLYVVTIMPRPEKYNPLAVKNLDSTLIRRLGQSGKDCYASIIARDAKSLGKSLNDCMKCWEAILPGTVRHENIRLDLMKIWKYYASKYHGAMYSGCGGGYMYVISDEPVPGGFKVKVRV